MFLVNTITVLADEIPGGLRILFALIPMAFLFTVWMLSWKMSDTGSPDVRFACGAGLYGCYILGAAALFVLAAPIPVSNMVESGMIAAEDASIYTAVIISIVFVIWNVIGLAGVIAWHFRKKRKEMSEMDRMKLADI